MDRRLNLSVLPERLAVCRLPANAELPAWVGGRGLVSVTRTEDELSVVVPQSSVVPGVQCESDFRALRVQGPLDFSTVGVVASLASPLAEAAISIFVLSTYDTDYVLVRERDLERALAVLRAVGHVIEEQ